MSEYTYGEREPVEKCPYCGASCDAPFVDIGLGFQQVGPYNCECGAVQIGPYDKPSDLSDDEKRTGWYAPMALAAQL